MSHQIPVPPRSLLEIRIAPKHMHTLIVKTPTNPQRKVGFDNKMTLHHHPPTTETRCQQYISCFWPNFVETFRFLPPVTGIFVQVIFVLTKEVWSKKICWHKLWPPKIWSKKFDQNLISNSWDIFNYFRANFGQYFWEKLHFISKNFEENKMTYFS